MQDKVITTVVDMIKVLQDMYHDYGDMQIEGYSDKTEMLEKLGLSTGDEKSAKVQISTDGCKVVIRSVEDDGQR